MFTNLTGNPSNLTLTTHLCIQTVSNFQCVASPPVRKQTGVSPITLDNFMVETTGGGKGHWSPAEDR